MEESVAAGFTARSPVEGTVKAVTSSRIYVTDKDGASHEVPVYGHYPLNQGSYLHTDIKVKVGDKVKEGALLGDSNFSRDGALALGRNLRVGYLPYKGYNFEDGIVISETTAQKLTSQHLAVVEGEVPLRTTKSKFLTIWPGRYSAAQMAKLDDSGMAKPGAVLEPGDPVHLAMRLPKASVARSILGRIHKTLAIPYADATTEWDGHTNGTEIGRAHV